ncbi:MAG: protein BatD [Bacteroidales bacterium]|nr:MAG: protein BatD [Bacteroidales bacterium]
MRSVIIIILSVLSGLSGVIAQEVKFTATATPRVLRTGEQFQLVYEINTSASELEVPEFKDFQLLGGPSTGSSSSIQFQNGKTTRTVKYTYTYYLLAIKEGTFTIPSASAKIKRDTYKSNSVQIEVVKDRSGTQTTAPSGQPAEKSGAGADTPSGENLFIRLHVNKTSAYVGEQIIAWIKIYSKVNLSQVDPNFKGPDFKGFYQQPVEIQALRSLERENVNGEIYGTGILRKVVLFPQRTGEVVIQPFDIDVAYQKQVRRRTKSFFDDFFGPSVQNVPVTLTSKKVRINIKPLPPDKPASFTGAVGTFKLNASINKTDVTTNDAVTIKVNVSGKGNIKLIDDLNVNFPPSLETFKPVVRTVQENALSGSQSFEYTIIPRHAGEFKISPIKFSYFDPSSKLYKTLSTREFNISVTKGKEDTTSVIITGLSKEDVKLLGSDILFIKNKPFELVKMNRFIIGSVKFYAIYLLSILLFVIFIIIRRKSIKRNANVSLVKNRRANKYARKRLKKALSMLKKNNHESFYEEVLKAMWGYLSDKLNIPVADLSKDTSREALIKNNINQELMNTFYYIIDNCEYARFSPEHESTEMHKLYNDAIKTIIKLQQKLK